MFGPRNSRKIVRPHVFCTFFLYFSFTFSFTLRARGRRPTGHKNKHEKDKSTITENCNSKNCTPLHLEHAAISRLPLNVLWLRRNTEGAMFNCQSSIVNVQLSMFNCQCSVAQKSKPSWTRSRDRPHLLHRDAGRECNEARTHHEWPHTVIAVELSQRGASQGALHNH